MKTVGYLMGLGATHQAGLGMLRRASGLRLGQIFVLEGGHLLMPAVKLALAAHVGVHRMRVRSSPPTTHPACRVNALTVLAAMSACKLFGLEELAIGPFHDPRAHPHFYDGFNVRTRVFREEHGIELLCLHTSPYVHPTQNAHTLVTPGGTP